MKPLCHTFVQVRVCAAENDLHRAPEFFKARSRLCPRADRAEQILIQSEKSRASARHGVELLVQQRNKLIPDLLIPEEPANLPPIHATEDPVVEHG